MAVSFKIKTYLPGSVLKRTADNSHWKTTYGEVEHRTDPYFGGSPPFKAELRSNLPFRFDHFGLINLGTLSSVEMWNQMYAVLKTISDQVYYSVEWVSEAVPSVPELNAVVVGVDSGQYDYQRGTPSPAGCVVLSDPTPCAYGSTKEGAAGATQGDINYYLGGGTPPMYCQPSGYPTPYGHVAYNSTIDGTAPYKYSGARYIEQNSYGPTYDPDNDFCGMVILGGVITGTGGSTAAYAYAKIYGVSMSYTSGTVAFYNYATFDVVPLTITVNTSVAPFYESSVVQDEFNSMGDPVRYDQWTGWDSEHLTGNPGTATSTKLGDLVIIDLPILPTDPAEPSTNFEVSGSAAAGYNVTGALGIVPYFFPFIG